MTKTARTLLIAFAVASLLFLFAPTFRQALKVTAGSWRLSDSFSDSSWTKEMRSLGAKAEATHDAETLAFVAMQMRYDSENRAQRDKFADEAVQWNRQLTWIYFPLLHDYAVDRGDPNDTRWLACLQTWDPNNAAVYAREASYYRPRGVTGLNPLSDRAVLASSPRWLSDMDKVFSATEYDSYLSRKAALDREVSQRHGLDDPNRMLFDMMFYPLFENFDFDLYAKDFLLKAGEDFEAKGDFGHAEENYWKVAHLGELIQLRGESDSNIFVSSELELSADPRLEAIFEKSANSSAAKLVAYQTALARQVKSRLLAKNRQDDERGDERFFDASILQLSLLVTTVSLILIVACGLYFVLRRVRSAKTVGLSRAFSMGGILGAILLFTSAVVMYFGYAPYADAFRGYLATPDPLNARESLLRFWGLGKLPSGLYSWFNGLPFRLYFWYTVIAVGGATIAWIILRRVLRTFHPHAPVHPAA